MDGTGKGRDGQTYSIELCGGTHVKQTGDIGVFVALGDSASSSGVRRIEALTGQAAFDYLSAQDHRMAELALEMNAQPGDVLDRVRALKDDRKRLENEVTQLRQQLAMSGGASAAPEARAINGIPFLAQSLRGRERQGSGRPDRRPQGADVLGRRAADRGMRAARPPWPRA